MGHLIESFISNPNFKGHDLWFIYASITIAGYYSGLSINIDS